VLPRSHAILLTAEVIAQPSHLLAGLAILWLFIGVPLLQHHSALSSSIHPSIQPAILLGSTQEQILFDLSIRIY
jgi:hypothetical protein